MSSICSAVEARSARSIFFALVTALGPLQRDFQRFVKSKILGPNRLSDMDSKQKQNAEREMAKLQHLIVANVNMLPEAERAVFLRQIAEAVPPAGITDAIRQVFRANPRRALTPVQVKEALMVAGFDVTSQANTMASIHSVIRRLLSADEIEPFRDATFSGYRWKRKPPSPTLHPLTGG